METTGGAVQGAATKGIGETFVPIGDYGFLSDGETTALVAPGGSVDWMCLPRMDSPSVFGAILGRHAGTFRVAPTDVTVPAARRYLPGTMVLETSWGTDTGWIIVRDVLLLGPVAARGGAVALAAAHPHRLRGRAHPAAHDPLREGRGADGRSSASRCPTTAAAARAGSTPTRSITRAQMSVRGLGHARSRSPPTCASASRAAGPACARCSRRARPASSRCRGAARNRRSPTTTPTGARCGRRTTGSTGWPAASSPTTRGAATCSAARSPSRA